ncbi:MAG TPA: phosphoribosylanthranilate isomerase [Acidocella sp.]|nr:MAG: hypothetical protein B7Z71_12430 [Acidocella sp. 21-58-7]HQU04923.1 phosphoribosylanthranilate isomerase [Acidocella sp.]
MVEAGADYLGFVFFKRSPRFVTAAEAANLSARYGGGPQRVGLFVQPDIAAIQAVRAELQLDVLQIYGDPALCREISEQTNLPVWRAVGVRQAEDLPTAIDAETGLVIEAAPPKDATRPGGNAVTFDWSILRGWQTPVPWLLAGGLSVENVAEAIRISNAPGVDVSSGVETAPGEKSAALIKQFVLNARNASRWVQ